ncbi:MAG: cation:proton antiporter [Verrucomicrobiales bacterium]|nr:cation:proton antiporter [Verrucomicrobiales bacterium]
MEHSPLTDIAICIVAAWLFGVVAQVLRQPVLLAYLVAGYVIGPQGLGYIKEDVSVESISGIGLVLLLFVIGLEIDLKRVLGSGRAILVTALVQILGTVVLGLGLVWASGLPQGTGRFTGLYLAIASVVSSTVIAVKLLGDKRELDTLAGRLTLGISVIQDIAVISFLGLQPALDSPSAAVVLGTFARIGLLIGVTLGFSRFVLPTLFHRVANLPELVVVGALAWCFIIAALANKLHLSSEMGALVAGVAISTFPYHLDVTAKVTSLRDFFITLFFVGLGLRIPAPEIGPVGLAVALCGFVVVSRVLTVMVPLRLLGLGNRIGVLTTLNLMPISEFALVIITLGIKANHVDPSVFASAVYAFFLLAVIGSYAINGSDPLFRALEPWLHRVGLRDVSATASGESETRDKPDIYLLGFSWTASSLLEEIEKRNPSLLPRLVVIDFNPEVHRRLSQRGVHAVWGDIAQRDTLEHAGLRDAKLILCTLPNIVLKGTTNVRLVQLIRSLNPEAAIIAHAEVLADVGRLKEAGATYVVVARLGEADEFLSAIDAATQRLLPDKFAELERRLADRTEIIP